MKLDKKILRIKTLINRLENGIDISTSSLSRVLSEEQFNDYKNEWKSYIDSSKDMKPIEIKKYERKIKIATLHYWRMEKYSLIPSKNRLAKKFGHKSDNEFELALEYLKDALNSNTHLRLWIDRDPAGCEYHPDSVPRCVTSSKSSLSLKEALLFSFSSKRVLKIQTLQCALQALEDGNLFDGFENVTFKNYSISKKYEFVDFIF
jgi:hypothetical protein